MIPLEEEIKKTNHSREKRNNFANLIVENPVLLPELLRICSRADEISCKACWGLEFLCKNNLGMILPYLDQLMPILFAVHQHSAVRPMSKICELLVLAYYKNKSSEVKKHLTTIHREKITEACFDWLISDQKVAPKAYAMTSLYLLGTEFDWIHSELKIILENNYHEASAAYKARSRIILKKLR